MLDKINADICVISQYEFIISVNLLPDFLIQITLYLNEVESIHKILGLIF